MDDRLRLGVADRLPDGFRVAQLGVDEDGPVVHRRAMPFGEIVIDRHFVSRVQEFLDTDRTNVAGAAGNKYIHSLQTNAPAMDAQS